MNAIISAIKEQKDYILANDARLLKKSLFGFVILTIAFQSGPLSTIIRQNLIDAYLQVSVFVAFTLMIFIGFDSSTNFNVSKILKKTKKFHIVIAAFLGALPGCGGAIIVVTQYIQGRLGFGSLIAVLTATMGDGTGVENVI